MLIPEFCLIKQRFQTLFFAVLEYVHDASFERLVFSVLWRIYDKVAYLCHNVRVEGLQCVAVFYVIFCDSFADELRFYLLEPH